MAPIRSRRTLRPRWPRGGTKRNAAERVFNIPELVSEIVHWQVQGLGDFAYEKSRDIGGKKQWVMPTKFRRWTYGRGTKREPYMEDQAGYLWQFAALNRAWYTEVIHRQRIWKNTMGAMNTPAVSRSLDVIFAKVPAHFRQQYADHVELASLVTVDAGDARAADAALRDVRFPKLRVLKLCVRGSSRDSDIRTLMDGAHIPCIQGESVTVLSICSHGGREPEWRWPLHGLPEDWAELFRRISVCFCHSYFDTSSVLMLSYRLCFRISRKSRSDTTSLSPTRLSKASLVGTQPYGPLSGARPRMKFRASISNTSLPKLESEIAAFGPFRGWVATTVAWKNRLIERVGGPRIIYTVFTQVDIKRADDMMYDYLMSNFLPRLSRGIQLQT